MSTTPMRAARPALIHPAWLRLFHWANALAVIILIFSGWRIYNASPIWPSFRFPEAFTLGGWLGGALLWHFAAMWLLFVNGLAYLLLNLASGRARQRFWPLRLGEVFTDLAAALRGKLAHDDPHHYNGVQKLAYLFVVFDSILVVLSGLVVWKSVQFPLLRALMGGFDTARIVHFAAMAGLVVFLLVHLVMVALVPRTLLYMTRGR
jgi:thiosulfate reductase cytochrome b subunit